MVKMKPEVIFGTGVVVTVWLVEAFIQYKKLIINGRDET